MISMMIKVLNDRLRGGFSGCFPNVIVFAILNNIEERWNAKKMIGIQQSISSQS